MWKVLILSVGVLSACTTAERINRPNGELSYIIACGAGLGWNICYNRANELCPQGYVTLSKEAGFNRKEMEIACSEENKPAAYRHPQSTQPVQPVTPPATSVPEFWKF